MNVILIGYGKMGKTIEQLATAKGHEIAGKTGPGQEKKLPQLLKNADVAIEFSRPEAAFNNVMACLQHGIPVVSGTTGWNDKLQTTIAECHKRNGAFFYASNFSIGVNIFFEINKKLAALMQAQPQYSPQITEIHHTSKLDAPSGTAITLADQLLQNLDTKTSWTLDPTPGNTQIPIKSIRRPDVPGTHSIVYHSGIDDIEIKHTAHSRQGFASGALMAAEWIIGKNGFFQMKDMMNF